MCISFGPMYSSHYHFHSHILFLSYNLSVQIKSRNEENPETFVLDTIRTVALEDPQPDYPLIDRIFRRYHHSRKGPDVSNIKRKKGNEVLKEYQKSKNGLKILDLSRIYLLWNYLHHYYLAVIVNLKKIDPTCKQEYG
jgi:hypothetical protein